MKTSKKVRFELKDINSFSYNLAHVLGFNLVAILWKKWKPKYIFHDWEKPWLHKWFKGDYKKVQKWHISHRKHHITYPKPKKIKYDEVIMDWQSCPYTKEFSPLDAFQYYDKIKLDLPFYQNLRLRQTFEELGPFKLFSKEDRSTFPYYFAHVVAFNMTALLLRRWKPKYIFHDWEKPWLMLLWKDYGRVQKWHREHRRHHLEYPDKEKIDWEALIIDWECSRFTKEASPLDARGEYEKVKMGPKFTSELREKFETTLKEMNL